MKRKMVRMMAFGTLACAVLTSCYSYTEVVGKGPQKNQQEKKWNHYMVYGLVPVSRVSKKDMVGDTENYAVKIEHSFINGLLSAVTFGIYSPTTVTVTK